MRVPTLLLILIIGLHPIGVVAQSPVQIKGMVIDAANRLPVPYAHVGIPSLGIGVSTNDVGAFQLIYYPESEREKLQISHLGFETHLQLISTIRQQDSLIIALVPNIYDTEEVVVRPGAGWPKEVLRKSLRRLQQNYPTNLYQMDGFYREKSQRRDDYHFTRLLEATLHIQDPGIKTHPAKIRVELNELRKSDDFTEYDPNKRSWREVFGEQNHLYKILFQNPVRLHFHPRVEGEKPRTTHYRLRQILSQPDSCLRMAGITSYDGRKVYQFVFDYLPHQKYIRYTGQVFIDSEDMGIYRVVYRQSLDIFAGSGIDTTNLEEDRRKHYQKVQAWIRNSAYEENFSDQVTVDYRRVNNQYFLSRIEHIDLSGFSKSKLSGKKNTATYDTATLMISTIERNKKQMERIRKWQMVNRNKDLKTMKRRYNKDFWKDFNILLATPLEQRLIQDLELRRSLEKQFEKNSN